MNLVKHIHEASHFRQQLNKNAIISVVAHTQVLLCLSNFQPFNTELIGR